MQFNVNKVKIQFNINKVNIQFNINKVNIQFLYVQHCFSAGLGSLLHVPIEQLSVIEINIVCCVSSV